MPEKTAPTRRTATERRTADFTVKQQLLGKLGPRGYGRLLEKLRKVSGDES